MGFPSHSVTPLVRVSQIAYLWQSRAGVVSQIAYLWQSRAGVQLGFTSPQPLPQLWVTP